MSDLKAQVEQLPESRVRIDVEVPAAVVERSIDDAARSLGRDMRIPGFRKGKVPPAVVIRRVGRDAVIEEALRASLGSWYAEAVATAGIDPIGDPKLDMGDIPEKFASLQFSIEVGVQPTAQLGEYKGLEVGKETPAIDGQDIENELEVARERLARLESVDRTAVEGDFTVIDFVGSVDGERFAGGEARDRLLELGSGTFVGNFEQQLVGAAAGDSRMVSVIFPEDYQEPMLAGKEAVFEVTVKDVREKILPEFDDEFAVQAGGFDSLQELKDDIRGQLLAKHEAASEDQFRGAVVEAVAAQATIDLPDSLVKARAAERWEQLKHSLSHRGISPEAYLQIAGKSEEEVVSESEGEAARELANQAVINAVVEAEQIEPSEEQIAEALQPIAEREGLVVEEAVERLRRSGRLENARRELAERMAVDLLVEAAKPIERELAKAREELWTPEKSDSPEGGEKGALWTPSAGS